MFVCRSSGPIIMGTMGLLHSPTRSARKQVPSKVMRLRPVLEHRMPTLANKAAFLLPPGEELSALPGPRGSRHPHHPPLAPGGGAGAQSRDQGPLQQAAPPRTMRDVRAAVTKEIKSLTRKLARVEREYYGERKTVYNEVEKYVLPIKMLMKAQWILDLNKASEVEEMIRQCSNSDRLKGDPTHAAMLKEAYDKVQAFLPDKIAPLLESCQAIYNNLDRYCVSFYDAQRDCYLETPAHYTEQTAVWKEKAQLSIQSATTLSKKFRTTGITVSMFSSPVAQFCSRCDINKLLFLVLFADACTHIRSALSVLSLWLRTDETYAGFVKNDLAELEKLREEKTKALRYLRQKCHSLTYNITKLESDQAGLTHDVQVMGEKEHSLRIDEVSIVNTLNDIELEIEFKERRREAMKKRPPSSDCYEPTAETMDTITSELKILKERRPGVLRSLGQVHLKLSKVDHKLDLLDKLHKDLQAIRKELKQAEKERDLKEQEFSEIEEASQLARKILLCKTANDATQKLYYSVPFGTKSGKAKGEVKDPMKEACRIISARVERDWVALYRALPFYPQRGAETVEHDIVELRETGARTSVCRTSRLALDRWRRYHTRANVEDLRQALRATKRLDILRALDESLRSPRIKAAPPTVVDPFDKREEDLPPVEPKLVPFYRLVERYDQIRASKVKS